MLHLSSFTQVFRWYTLFLVFYIYRSTASSPRLSWPSAIIFKKRKFASLQSFWISRPIRLLKDIVLRHGWFKTTKLRPCHQKADFSEFWQIAVAREKADVISCVGIRSSQKKREAINGDHFVRKQSIQEIPILSLEINKISSSSKQS